METNPRNLIVPALLATSEAGRSILEVYSNYFGVELKNDRTPLTLADRVSHKTICERLCPDEFSRIPILSEERKNILFEERSNLDYLWLVDPLDETKEFIKRNGEFTVNIALIHENRPILGVIHAPVNDLFYFAVDGHWIIQIRVQQFSFYQRINQKLLW